MDTYHVVCRAAHVVSAASSPQGRCLALKKVTERDTKVDAINTLDSSLYGFLQVPDACAAAIALNLLVLPAENSESTPVIADRFSKKKVTLGPDVYHFLEIQLTRRETEDLSQMTDCAFKWVKAKEVVKRMLKDGTATSVPLALPAITFLTALRDNAVRPEQKLFPQNLVVKQGILYYVPHANADGREEDSAEPLQARVVVPESLRLKLLFTAHDLPSSGHRGGWGTYQALKRRYWWPQMRKSVYHYCKGCMRC